MAPTHAERLEPHDIGCYEGVVRRTGCAGEFSQLRRQKFDRVATGLPLHWVEELAQWLEQRVARARDAAADDGSLAIQNVDEGTNGRGQRFDGSEPDFCGGGVAGVVRSNEIV